MQRAHRGWNTGLQLTIHQEFVKSDFPNVFSIPQIPNIQSFREIGELRKEGRKCFRCSCLRGHLSGSNPRPPERSTLVRTDIPEIPGAAHPQGYGIIIKGLQGFTIVAYSPGLWLLASDETSSTSIKIETKSDTNLRSLYES